MRFAPTQKSLLKKAKISFHSDEYELPWDQKKLKLWMQTIISGFGKVAGEIHYYLCNDEDLLEINRQYLQHDYYTDIISFQYDPDVVAGDIYISYQRICENASNLKVEEEEEWLRVLIHGILHFCGVKDKSSKDTKQMRKLEEDAIHSFKHNYLQEQSYYDLVFAIVKMIPRGKVTSYSAISKYLSLGSPRMVGYALHSLRGSKMGIPAHRVVNAKGELSGRHNFGGDKAMENLLRSEGVVVENDKVINFPKIFWQPE